MRDLSQTGTALAWRTVDDTPMSLMASPLSDNARPVR
jgi:hypothetical protein